MQRARIKTKTIPAPRKRGWRRGAALVLIIARFACAPTPSLGANPNDQDIRTEKMTFGPVELSISAEPAKVAPDRDLLLTIAISAPPDLKVQLPPIENRLTGFTLSGSFTREPELRDGKTVIAHCFRLTPNLADEHRLAPMAVTVAGLGQSRTNQEWFATRAMLFETAPVATPPPGAGLRDPSKPVWIYPAFKTVALWVAAILLALALSFALYRLSCRLKRAIKLRRMSPRERALAELAELMGQNLIAQNLFKEFFLSLTMIVRRYIERAHKIRAPEQTTEEFLAAVARDTRFRPEVIAKLRKFLQTADLVKFAVYRPDQTVVDMSFDTARDYITTDEQTGVNGRNENV